jgi:hypothetical protein
MVGDGTRIVHILPTSMAFEPQIQLRVGASFVAAVVPHQQCAQLVLYNSHLCCLPRGHGLPLDLLSIGLNLQ